MSVHALRVDSFDYYDAAQLTQAWDVVNGGTGSGAWDIVSGAGRRGTNALQWQGGNGNFSVGKVMNMQGTAFSIGFAYNANAEDFGGNYCVCGIGSSSPNYGGGILSFIAAAGGAINIYNWNSAWTGLGTPPGYLVAGEYHHYEIVITPSTNAGVGQVAFYRDTNLFYTTPNFQTQYDVTPSIVYLGIVPGNGFSAAHGLYDDFYVADNFTGGSLPVGDCKVLIQLPNAAGLDTEWSVTGESDNWQATGNNPSTGDSAYVSSDTVNQVDAYALSAPASTFTELLAVSVKAYARKEDSGNRQIGLGVGNGTTNVFDSGHGVGTTYGFIESVLNVNPITDAAWETSDVTDLQVAIKVIS